jgi:hypothetical protein
MIGVQGSFLDFWGARGSEARQTPPPLCRNPQPKPYHARPLCQQSPKTNRSRPNLAKMGQFPRVGRSSYVFVRLATPHPSIRTAFLQAWISEIGKTCRPLAVAGLNMRYAARNSELRIPRTSPSRHGKPWESESVYRGSMQAGHIIAARTSLEPISLNGHEAVRFITSGHNMAISRALISL